MRWIVKWSSSGKAIIFEMRTKTIYCAPTVICSSLACIAHKFSFWHFQQHWPIRSELNALRIAFIRWIVFEIFIQHLWICWMWFGSVHFCMDSIMFVWRLFNYVHVIVVWSFPYSPNIWQKYVGQTFEMAKNPLIPNEKTENIKFPGMKTVVRWNARGACGNYSINHVRRAGTGPRHATHPTVKWTNLSKSNTIQRH